MISTLKFGFLKKIYSGDASESKQWKTTCSVYFKVSISLKCQIFEIVCAMVLVRFRKFEMSNHVQFEHLFMKSDWSNQKRK